MCMAHALVTINVFHYFIVSVKVFPSLKQNLMLIHYSWISAISNITRHTLHAREQIALVWRLITEGWHGK
jgi:hypothetical protein